MSDWQLDRLPGDVRLEAENAAQRDGLPLHRWLGKMIRDICAEEGVAPARELSRVAANGTAMAPQRRAASTIAVSPAAPEPPIRMPPPQERAAAPSTSERPPVEAPRPVARTAPTAADILAEFQNSSARRMAAMAAAMPSAVPRVPPLSPQSTASASVSPKPLGRPPMPTMPPPPPAPTPARFAIEPAPVAARQRQEPIPPAQPAQPAPTPRDDRIIALTQLVRSLQRNELSPVAEARLFLKLMTENMASIGDLTVATGRTREQITRTLRLLGLSDRLRDLIERGALSREQAFALLDTDDPEAANPVVPPSASGQFLQ